MAAGPEGQDQWQDMYALTPSNTVRSVPDAVYCVVKILRVLGEGGFSFVYLAQDEASQVRL